LTGYRKGSKADAEADGGTEAGHRGRRSLVSEGGLAAATQDKELQDPEVWRYEVAAHGEPLCVPSSRAPSPLPEARPAIELKEERVADLTTEVTGIGSYLSQRRLAIPDYQRSYSWRAEEEVKELWDDIAAAIAKGQGEYFLGAVVVIKRNQTDRLLVIDGQQRLATVSLVYAALRDIYASRADERATEIQQEVLGRKDRATRVVTQFLALNAEDNDYFKQITLATPADRTIAIRSDSHRRLQEAFDFLTTGFQGLIGGLGATEWPAPLIRWDKYLMDQTKIIEVSVPDESRGYVIFETLNDRGLSLSTSDLLKNHLLGTAAGRIEEAKVRWARATAAFNAPDSNLDMETFLRHFWASRKGVVRVKDLFWQMKGEITSPDSAVGLASDLEDASRYWTAMFDRDADVWRGYRAGPVSALDTLSNLKVEQCRPLLLAALGRLPKEEVERLLPLLVSWSVRWILAGGGSAGTTERLYAESAKKVTEGTLTTAAQIAAEFATAVPSDPAFQQAFAVANVRRSWLARYYLRTLERAKRNQAEPELVPNQDVDAVNLEHVLPRNPNSQDWQIPADVAELLTYALGNQCLMRRTPNDAVGNKSFGDKKTVLAASDFELTREIGSETSWGRTEIEARQQRLAVLAVTAWPKA
jgi:hypothetical protein